MSADEQMQAMSSPAPGQEVVSPQARYEILGLLGSGAGSGVYLALRRSLQQHRQDAPAPGHPLCTLKTAVTETGARQLRLEADLLATLDHPGVPRPVEVFVLDGVACLAAEHRPGRTLERLLAEARGPLPPQSVIGWALQVTDILEYLHSRSEPVIHRDIKPANLLLGDDGRLLLLDFGAARRYNAHKPGDTVLLGSPEYAAPEQFQATSQSRPYTDIWGLGATCFRLLTGRGPDRLFTFPPLCEVKPDLPVSLEAVLDRALQYEPERRYRSAAEMREGLARALSVVQDRAWGPPLPRASAEVAATAAFPESTATQRDSTAALRRGRRPSRAQRGGGSWHGGDSRLVVAAWLLSPIISAAMVGFTVYLALATRSPLPFAPRPPGLDGAGAVVETALGSLVVSSTPEGAQVELDGAPLQNRTPLRVSQLTAGSHQMTVRLSGYTDEERMVEIRAGETANLALTLTPLVRLSLGRVAADGTWTAWDGRALKPQETGGLFLRLEPQGLADRASASAVTLQVVLRLPDGTARTLYSGPYAWGQPRRVRLASPAPGAYTLEATVLGPDVPPVTQSVTLKILSEE